MIEECQRKIDENEEKAKKLEILGEQSDEAKEIHDKFLKLQEEFEEQHGSDLFKISSMKKIAREDDIEHLSRCIKRYKEQTEMNNAKMKPTNEKIAKLRAERDAEMLEKLEIEKQMKTLEDSVQSFEKQEKALDDANNEQKDKKIISNWRLKVINELKEEFPQRVLGRLSEFYGPKGNKVNANVEFIKGRLGKYSKAIVVDTRTTANECIDYLKIKNLTPITEVFLPLSDLAYQKSSKSFLPGGKVPPKLISQFMEDLFMATNESVEKALVFCLKPSLVLGSLENAEKALTWSESKKLNVVSTEAGTCFNTNGILERNVKGVDEGLTEEELIECELKQSQLWVEIIKVNAAVGAQATKLALLTSKISSIDSKIDKLEASLAPYLKANANEMDKIQQLEIKLSELLMDKTRLEQQ